jgi:hypothetical protein
MSLSSTGVPAISVVLLALQVCAPIAALADQAITPLGKLAGDASFIVIGGVSEVTSGPSPGAFVMAVEVEETLKGSGLSRFTLAGSDRNEDSVHRLSPGTTILAFLENPGPALAEPVSGEQGIVVVDETTLDDSREIVIRALQLGDGLRIGDFQDLMRKDSEAPPALLGSLTEELTLKLTPNDGALIGEMACDAGGVFLPAVQLWAIGQVGAQRFTEARSCLQGMLPIAEPRALSIASAEALGELGDRASVPALVTLLETLPSDPRLFPDRGGDSTVPTGNEDPEDDGDPVSDPDERSDPGESEVTPPPTTPTEPDGQREPDDAPREDRGNRGADGGLAEAAILALGKIGDPAAVPLLFRIAREGDDLALHSTAVHALGLIGGATVRVPLLVLSLAHPNPLVREQAKQTIARPRRAGEVMR